MAKVDQLILKAKGVFEAKKEKLIFGRIEHLNDKWNCDFMVWDGVTGSGGRSIESIHNTYEEAVAEAHRVFEEFPNDASVKIIVVDCEAK